MIGKKTKIYAFAHRSIEGQYRSIVRRKHSSVRHMRNIFLQPTFLKTKQLSTSMHSSKCKNIFSYVFPISNYKSILLAESVSIENSVTFQVPPKPRIKPIAIRELVCLNQYCR